MNAVSIKNWVIAIAALVALYILFRLYLWVSEKGVGGVTADIFGGAVEAAQGAVVGTLTGVSKTVGIPTPNADECKTDLAGGSFGRGFFTCDNSTYFKAVFNKVFSTEPLKNQFKNVQAGSSTTAVSVKDFSSTDKFGNVAY